MDEKQMDDNHMSDELDDDEDRRRQYGDREFLSAIQEHDNPTTSDVGRKVGCTPQAALYRLNLLEDENVVSSTKIGNAKVWSVV